jgi:hypothetical protein
MHRYTRDTWADEPASLATGAAIAAPPKVRRAKRKCKRILVKSFKLSKSLAEWELKKNQFKYRM